MTSFSSNIPHRRWWYATCVLAFSLAMRQGPAIASRQGPPPDDLPPTTGGRSAGSRGCGLQDAKPLELVIPPLAQTYTRSPRPTLAWSGDNFGHVPVEFRLYRYDAQTQSTQLVHELEDPKTRNVSGLTIFQWPESLPPLALGVQYIWQVELVCDRDRPSGNMFADAPIKVIEADNNPDLLGYDALLPLKRPY